MFIEPTADQIAELTGGDDAGPVVMLNLLRFVPETGPALYQRYAEGVLPLVAGLGGRLVWQGRADSVVIGDVEADAWDAVALVQYPSRRAFLQMVGSAEYQAIADLRHQALVDSRLIACTGSQPAGRATTPSM